MHNDSCCLIQYLVNYHTMMKTTIIVIIISSSSISIFIIPLCEVTVGSKCYRSQKVSCSKTEYYYYCYYYFILFF